MTTTTTSGLPEDAPPWAKDLAASYVTGAASVFLLHGNLHDLVRIDDHRFVPLEDYLATQIFGRRDGVLTYDRGRGIDFAAPGDEKRRREMRRDFDRTLTAIDSINGTSFAKRRPRDAATVLEILDRYITHKMLERPDDGERRSLAILIKYVETIAPTVDVASLTGELGSNLLRLMSWANDPAIRNADITLCLLTENLADANRRLVENPFIAKLEIPLPDETTRRAWAAI